MSVISLAEGLRDDFDIQIIAGPQTGPEGSLQRCAAATAPLTVVDALRREISPRWDPVAVPALRRLLRRLDGDIVHTHSSKAGIVGRFAAAPLRARAVHTVHGWGHTPADSPLRRAAFMALERAAARRCDALLAVSADNRAEGLAHNIGQPDLYHVIPEPVELEPVVPAFMRGRSHAREVLGIDADVEVIGWVGRFVDQKDPDTLARVVIDLLHERPGSLAVLVGDGPRRGDVEAALGEAELSSRVTFTGVVGSARMFMPAFDVLVHPSRWEGQPRVVQEALAERVPVVSARASGIGELIQDGKTGFTVAPHSPEEMVKAATVVLESAELRAPLASSSLDELKSTHGRAVVLDRHRALYDALLKDTR